MTVPYGRTTRVREFWADCSLCVLEADIPYIMELALSNLDCTKDAPSVAAIDSVKAGLM